jgi:hypothetical protein
VTTSLLKKIKLLLPSIGVIIFIYIIYNLNLTEITTAFLSIPPAYILLSALLNIPVLLIRNSAWRIIQKEQHISLDFSQSLKALIIGYFYATISPGYLGQPIRVLYIKEKTAGAPYGKLFVNTVIETLLRSLSLYLLMVIGGLIVLREFPQLFYITVAWVIIVLIVIGYFIKQQRGERLFYQFIKYFIPSKLKPPLNRFVSTFYKDLPGIRLLWFPFILGALTWIIIFTQEYLFVVALGLNIPYLYFLVLFPVANTAGFLPISFAGLGTRELTAIFLFTTFFSVTKEEVFVFSFMGFLITDIFIGFTGFILALIEARKRRRRD